MREIKTKDAAEKAAAKAAGLSRTQYLLLRALSDGQDHTYKDIVMTTGIHSNLPADFRVKHPKSLGAKGLVTESTYDIDGKDVIMFKITTAGRKVLEIAGTKLLEMIAEMS